jgi:hypothetical protein
MFMSMAALAIALQGMPALAPETRTLLLHQIRSRRHGHPPPCGDGYDLDERDGLCYRNGEVPPQFQSGRYYPLKYGGGRQPVQCGTGADLDSRDGFCYPTGTVPRRFQAARQRHRDN